MIMKMNFKKNLKFAGKCLLCLIPLLALCIYTILCPMCYMDEEYPSWKYTGDVVKGEEGEEYYDTVILGDSGAMSSFVPDILTDDSCVNLAVGGATSVEMLSFFKDYLLHHEAPGRVVIMFAPFHYWHIDNYKTRTVYFKSMSLASAKILHKNAEYCMAESVCFEDYPVYEFSCRLGLPTVYLPAITASKFVGRYDINKQLYENLKNTNGYGTFGEEEFCNGVSYEASYNQIDFTGDTVLVNSSFDTLIHLCDEAGCKVYVIMPALNEATYNMLNPGYLEQFFALVNQLCEGNDSAYIETNLRCYGNEYFGDESHLNRKGAEKFSSEIAEILRDN